MLYAILVVLILNIDQGLKYWVSANLVVAVDEITVIPNILSLVNYHNTGAAFSFLASANARWFFVVLGLVFTAAVIYAISKNIISEPLGRISAVMIVAGALGNIIDRIALGYVVDMFQVEFMNFAIFNVADIFITVGGVIFCAYIVLGDDFKEKDEPKEKKAKFSIGKKAAKAEETMEKVETADELVGPFFEDELVTAIEEVAEEMPQMVKTEVKKPVDEFSVDALLAEFGFDD